MKVTQPITLTLKYDLTVTGDLVGGKAKIGMFGSAKVAGTHLWEDRRFRARRRLDRAFHQP